MASIKCRYLDGTTKICDNTSSFSDIKVNGVSIGLTTDYNVNASDEVEFILKNNEVGAEAFSNVSGLVSVLFNNVKKIGNQVFRECTSLKSLNIPDSVISIGQQAFEDCTSLESVKLGNGVTYIYEYAFDGCQALQYVELGNNITDIYASAFRNCTSLKQIVCPDSLINIGYNTSTVGEPVYPEFGAFYGCTSLESVVFNNGLKKIADYCFRGCNLLKNIVIPDSVSVLGIGAFEECTSLESVKLGNGLYIINEFAFRYCRSLVTISIGDKIHTIKEQAFESCDKLQRLILSPNVRTIKPYAFADCDNLIKIYVKNTSCSIDEYTFQGVKENGTLYYPTGSDYSQWLSTDPYYLGYYDWNGVEMDPEDMPTTSWSVQLGLNYLVFEADGGTQLLDAIVMGATEGSLSWNASADDDYVSQKYLGQFADSPTKVTYSVTLGPNDGEARITYLTITGTDNTGQSNKKIKIYQKDINGNLPNDFNEDMDTGCYIILDGYEYTFPAKGGDYTVTGRFGFPAPNEGLSVRIYSGPVYPIRWCEAELRGGHIEDDGTEASEDWKITMSPNTFTETRECSVSFSYTNNYGESTSVIFTAKQEAAEEVDDPTPIISAYSKEGTVDADGTPQYSSLSSLGVGYKNLTPQTPTVNVDWIVLGEGVKDTGVNYTYDTVMRYPATYLPNEGNEQRVGVITFKGIDSEGAVHTSTTTITQKANAGDEPDTPTSPDTPTDTEDTTFSPIWKDVEYEFGGSDVTYGIYTETRYVPPGGRPENVVYIDNLIFKGRAYAKPNEPTIKVNINKVCQNYMGETYLKFDGSATGVGNAFNKFKLKDENGTLLHTYYFVGDWTYKPLTLGLKTNPITPYIGDGQKLFFSLLAQSKRTVEWGLRYYDGKSDYSNVEQLTNGFETEIMLPARNENVSMFSFGDKSYSVIPRCECGWVLYYLNPNGGYDWFTITGRVTRRDKLQTYTITQNFNNTTTDFGKKRYLSTIGINYQINTQWLTQAQSDRMWELLESNQVWLHNLETDEIMPVIITDTDIEHKQKTRTNKLISYQINVELSQGRERI